MGIKFMRINKYEPAADEKRLEEMAAKGEFLKRHFLFLGFFRKGNPQKVKYCIEPSFFLPNKKKRNVYAECGWKYEARGEDFCVYMSDDENAVPLHTERSEFAHIVKKEHTIYLAVLLFMYLLVAFDVLMPIIFFPMITLGEVRTIIFTLPLTYGFQRMFLEFSVFVALFMFPLLLIYLFFVIRAGRFVTGCIENKADADKAVRRNNLMTGILISLFVINIAMIGFYAYVSIDNSSEKIPSSELPGSVAAIDEIYTENIEFIQTDEAAEKYIDPELWEGNIKAFQPTSFSRTSVFSDCHYDYWQHISYIPEGREKGRKISMHSTYTEFRNNWLAKQGAEEFMEYEWYFFAGRPDRVQLSAEGTPYEKAEYFISDNSLYMVLLKGNSVQTIDISIAPESGLTPETIFENINEFNKE